MLDLKMQRQFAVTGLSAVEAHFKKALFRRKMRQALVGLIPGPVKQVLKKLLRRG